MGKKSASKIVHHLINIKSELYFLGCGRTFKLQEKGLRNCSHIEMVSCKKCKDRYRRVKEIRSRNTK